MDAEISSVSFRAAGLWGGRQAGALPLHLMRTYGGRVPLGSLLQGCSGADSGVTGRSACSVIRTSAVYDQGSSHRPIAARAEHDGSAPGSFNFLVTESRWRLDRRTEEPDRGGAGKGGGRSRERHQEQPGRGAGHRQLWEDFGRAWKVLEKLGVRYHINKLNNFKTFEIIWAQRQTFA